MFTCSNNWHMVIWQSFQTAAHTPVMFSFCWPSWNIWTNCTFVFPLHTLSATLKVSQNFWQNLMPIHCSIFSTMVTDETSLVWWNDHTRHTFLLSTAINNGSEKEHYHLQQSSRSICVNWLLYAYISSVTIPDTFWSDLLLLNNYYSIEIVQIS